MTDEQIKLRQKLTRDLASVYLTEALFLAHEGHMENLSINSSFVERIMDDVEIIADEMEKRWGIIKEET